MKLFSSHFAAETIGRFHNKEKTEVFIKLLAMKVIGFLSCLTALAAYTSGVEIECIYEIMDWGGTAGSFYTCDATVTSLENPATVTNIIGTHMAGRDNTHVESFHIVDHQILSTIPNGIENFFANLESFLWWAGNISSVNSSTFKPFPNLKDINLAYNRLVTLDGDLFQHTQNLSGVWFHSNSLQHVGHDLLNGLTELRRANFLSNPCISTYAVSPQSIEELNRQLPIQCPPLAITPDPPTTTISTTNEPNECPDTCTINEEAQEMRERIDEIERRLRELE